MRGKMEEDSDNEDEMFEDIIDDLELDN